MSSTNPEITNISAHGFWLFDDVSQQEYFLSFQNFPWFAKASVEQITTVNREGRSVFHWSSLDVDLDLDRIEHPERYPLLAKSA